MVTPGAMKRVGHFGRQTPNLLWTRLSPFMSTIDALTDAEKDTLAQLQAITNGADVDTQISLLQSVDWDLSVSQHALATTLANGTSLGGSSSDIW